MQKKNSSKNLGNFGSQINLSLWSIPREVKLSSFPEISENAVSFAKVTVRKFLSDWAFSVTLVPENMPALVLFSKFLEILVEWNP